MAYNPKQIEEKWQKKWQKAKTFQLDLDKAEKPFYNLMMFPYPSGEGLHVGHTYAFGGADAFGRFRRLQGYNVFEPMGFDAFGIHSENFAIKKGLHPRELIAKTTAYFREKQMKRYGGMWDWNRQVDTTTPQYYKWTQWIFVQMFKYGLAERKKSFVNWCPSCKTVLSDEQVEPKQGINVCERCKTEVTREKTEQWFFKISNYAKRLLDYHGSKWPETTKQMQTNWIGQSDGIEIEYEVEGTNEKLICFTTRPDTNFGATFIVLAPEHPQIEQITSKEYKKAVSNYVSKVLKKTEQERKIDDKSKTGVFTGSYAINRLNGKKLPIYVSDFVLMDVGTGAVVGVPGHDLRDFEFAKAMDLPIIRVVVGPDGDKSKVTKKEQVQEEFGTMVNSEFLNGMDIHKATVKIMNFMEKKGWGKRKTNYKLRDWCISRQRYWGPPIPMIYCENCAKKGESWFTTEEAKKISKGSKLLTSEKRLSLADEMKGWYPVSEKDLPIELPFVEDYQPKGKGQSPLATIEKFYKTTCPRCGKAGRRETDVSDTFLDSAWYFFRYPSTDFDNKVFDPERTKKWLPVDMYIGGNEHACLHLMYARFLTMAFYDMELINFQEPFKQFFAHGLIIKDGAKMSKSRGNVVNPNEYMERFGADALRMYLLFIGPYQNGGDFRDTGMIGMYKFLGRLYRLSIESAKKKNELSDILVRKLHQTIEKMTNDFSTLDFNTAIASLMELVNVWQREKKNSNKKMVGIVARLICPVAPFLAEELWELGGGKFSVLDNGWPKYDSSLVKDEEVEVIVQINGKMRDKLQVSAKISQKKDEVISLAKKSEKIAKYLSGKKIKKEVFVKGRLVNLVTN